jgi:hypothetical protein
MYSPDLTVQNVNQIKNMLNSIRGFHIKDRGDMVSFNNVFASPECP